MRKNTENTIFFQHEKHIYIPSLPPFFLTFLLSFSPSIFSSSFLSLLPFFPPLFFLFFLPSFFLSFLSKNLLFFLAPYPNLYFLREWGGGTFSKKNTFTFLLCILSFFPSFFLSFPPLFFPSFLPSFLLAFLLFLFSVEKLVIFFLVPYPNLYFLSRYELCSMSYYQIA